MFFAACSHVHAEGGGEKSSKEASVSFCEAIGRAGCWERVGK